MEVSEELPDLIWQLQRSFHSFELKLWGLLPRRKINTLFNTLELLYTELLAKLLSKLLTILLLLINELLELL